MRFFSLLCTAAVARLSSTMNEGRIFLESQTALEEKASSAALQGFLSDLAEMDRMVSLTMKCGPKDDSKECQENAKKLEAAAAAVVQPAAAATGAKEVQAAAKATAPAEGQPAAPAASSDDTEGSAEAQKMEELLKSTKNVPKEQLPLMLGLLSDMYDRFKQNIARSNELEQKSKKQFDDNMTRYKTWPESWKKDKAMNRMYEHWQLSRKLSHRHYHTMLKVAHAGMTRIKAAMDMMEKAIKGDALSPDQLASLKAQEPEVVLLGLADLIHRAQSAMVTGDATSLLEVGAAPEDKLAKEMTHDLEMNFNKIAPFGKEDTARELQDHAAKTQDTLVDAVENAEVAEIKRAVFRALTRLRAAAIKEFDTIARLETQAIDAYNDAHHFRGENALTHLHEDEAPIETDKLKSFH